MGKCVDLRGNKIECRESNSSEFSLHSEGGGETGRNAELLLVKRRKIISKAE